MPTLKFNLDEIKSFQITPGRYRLKLMKVEQTLSKSKKPMFVWNWKIVSGTEKGKTCRSWTLIGQDQNLGNLKAHLEAFGLEGRIKSTTDKLIGRTIIGTISNQVTTDPKTKQDRILATLISLERDPKDVDAMEDEADQDEDEVEVEDEEEDEEEETPRKKKVVAKKKPTSKFSKVVSKKRRPVDEDEEDEDEDEDEDLDDEDAEDGPPF